MLWQKSTSKARKLCPWATIYHNARGYHLGAAAVDLARDITTLLGGLRPRANARFPVAMTTIP